VRRFNRVVTQRAGALDDAFLARGRPLGQARVLWEIGPEGTDIRTLRNRLGLDSLSPTLFQGIGLLGGQVMQTKRLVRDDKARRRRHPHG